MVTAMPAAAKEERKMRNHWIGVVPWSHVQRGVAGGFVQLKHGLDVDFVPVRQAA